MKRSLSLFILFTFLFQTFFTQTTYAKKAIFPSLAQLNVSVDGEAVSGEVKLELEDDEFTWQYHVEQYRENHDPDHLYKASYKIYKERLHLFEEFNKGKMPLLKQDLSVEAIQKEFPAIEDQKLLTSILFQMYVDGDDLTDNAIHYLELEAMLLDEVIQSFKSGDVIDGFDYFHELMVQIMAVMHHEFSERNYQPEILDIFQSFIQRYPQFQKDFFPRKTYLIDHNDLRIKHSQLMDKVYTTLLSLFSKMNQETLSEEQLYVLLGFALDRDLEKPFQEHFQRIMAPLLFKGAETKSKLQKVLIRLSKKIQEEQEKMSLRKEQAIKASNNERYFENMVENVYLNIDVFLKARSDLLKFYGLLLKENNVLESFRKIDHQSEYQEGLYESVSHGMMDWIHNIHPTVVHADFVKENREPVNEFVKALLQVIQRQNDIPDLSLEGFEKIQDFKSYRDYIYYFYLELRLRHSIIDESVEPGDQRDSAISELSKFHVKLWEMLTDLNQKERIDLHYLATYPSFVPDEYHQQHDNPADWSGMKEMAKFGFQMGLPEAINFMSQHLPKGKSVYAQRSQFKAEPDAQFNPFRIASSAVVAFDLPLFYDGDFNFYNFMHQHWGRLWKTFQLFQVKEIINGPDSPSLQFGDLTTASATDSFIKEKPGESDLGELLENPQVPQSDRSLLEFLSDFQRYSSGYYRAQGYMTERLFVEMATVTQYGAKYLKDEALEDRLEEIVTFATHAYAGISKSHSQIFYDLIYDFRQVPIPAMLRLYVDIFFVSHELEKLDKGQIQLFEFFDVMEKSYMISIKLTYQLMMAREYLRLGDYERSLKKIEKILRTPFSENLGIDKEEYQVVLAEAFFVFSLIEMSDNIDVAANEVFYKPVPISYLDKTLQNSEDILDYYDELIREISADDENYQTLQDLRAILKMATEYLLGDLDSARVTRDLFNEQVEEIEEFDQWTRQQVAFYSALISLSMGEYVDTSNLSKRMQKFLKENMGPLLLKQKQEEMKKIVTEDLPSLLQNAKGLNDKDLLDALSLLEQSWEVIQSKLADYRSDHDVRGALYPLYSIWKGKGNRLKVVQIDFDGSIEELQEFDTNFRQSDVLKLQSKVLTNIYNKAKSYKNKEKKQKEKTLSIDEILKRYVDKNLTKSSLQKLKSKKGDTSSDVLIDYLISLQTKSQLSSVEHLSKMIKQEIYQITEENKVYWEKVVSVDDFLRAIFYLAFRATLSQSHKTVTSYLRNPQILKTAFGSKEEVKEYGFLTAMVESLTDTDKQEFLDFIQASNYKMEDLVALLYYTIGYRLIAEKSSSDSMKTYYAHNLGGENETKFISSLLEKVSLLLSVTSDFPNHKLDELRVLLDYYSFGRDRARNEEEVFKRKPEYRLLSYLSKGTLNLEIEKDLLLAIFQEDNEILKKSIELVKEGDHNKLIDMVAKSAHFLSQSEVPFSEKIYQNMMEFLELIIEMYEKQGKIEVFEEKIQQLANVPTAQKNKSEEQRLFYSQYVTKAKSSQFDKFYQAYSTGSLEKKVIIDYLKSVKIESEEEKVEYQGLLFMLSVMEGFNPYDKTIAPLLSTFLSENDIFNLQYHYLKQRLGTANDIKNLLENALEFYEKVEFDHVLLIPTSLEIKNIGDDKKDNWQLNKDYSTFFLYQEIQDLSKFLEVISRNNSSYEVKEDDRQILSNSKNLLAEKNKLASDQFAKRGIEDRILNLINQLFFVEKIDRKDMPFQLTKLINQDDESFRFSSEQVEKVLESESKNMLIALEKLENPNAKILIPLVTSYVSGDCKLYIHPSEITETKVREVADHFEYNLEHPAYLESKYIDMVNLLMRLNQDLKELEGVSQFDEGKVLMLSIFDQIDELSAAMGDRYLFPAAKVEAIVSGKKIDVTEENYLSLKQELTVSSPQIKERFLESILDIQVVIQKRGGFKVIDREAVSSFYKSVGMVYQYLLIEKIRAAQDQLSGNIMLSQAQIISVEEELKAMNIPSEAIGEIVTKLRTERYSDTVRDYIRNKLLRSMVKSRVDAYLNSLNFAAQDSIKVIQEAYQNILLYRAIDFDSENHTQDIKSIFLNPVSKKSIKNYLDDTLTLDVVEDHETALRRLILEINLDDGQIMNNFEEMKKVYKGLKKDDFKIHIITAMIKILVNNGITKEIRLDLPFEEMFEKLTGIDLNDTDMIKRLAPRLENYDWLEYPVFVNYANDVLSTLILGNEKYTQLFPKLKTDFKNGKKVLYPSKKSLSLFQDYIRTNGKRFDMSQHVLFEGEELDEKVLAGGLIRIMNELVGVIDQDEKVLEYFNYLVASFQSGTLEDIDVALKFLDYVGESNVYYKVISQVINEWKEDLMKQQLPMLTSA